MKTSKMPLYEVERIFSAENECIEKTPEERVSKKYRRVTSILQRDKLVRDRMLVLFIEKLQQQTPTNQIKYEDIYWNAMVQAIYEKNTVAIISSKLVEKTKKELDKAIECYKNPQSPEKYMNLKYTQYSNLLSTIEFPLEYSKLLSFLENLKSGIKSGKWKDPKDFEQELQFQLTLISEIRDLLEDEANLFALLRRYDLGTKHKDTIHFGNMFTS